MPVARGRLLIALVALSGCARIVGIQDLASDEGPDAGALPPRGDDDGGDGAEAEAEAEAAAPRADATRPPFKRVFVTSDRSNGVLGGMAGGDAKCAAAATRGSLTGAWVPWLSGEGVNAIDRITYDGPYQLLDGRVVVANKAQLTSGNLTNAIDVDETSAKVTSGTFLVWTGTAKDGKLFAVCSNWSTSNIVDFGTVGSLDRPTDGLWTDNLGPGGGFRNYGCQTNARLYCFER